MCVNDHDVYDHFYVYNVNYYVIFYLCVHVNDHDVNDHFYVCNVNQHDVNDYFYVCMLMIM